MWNVKRVFCGFSCFLPVALLLAVAIAPASAFGGVAEKRTLDAEPMTTIMSGEAPAGYSQPRQVKYSFELKNEKGESAENVDFRVYAPVAQTATQWCKELQLSHPAELITDELGNQVLHFHFEKLDAYSITIVRIKADLMISAEPQPQSLAKHNSIFSKPSEFVQSDQPEIQTAARKFKTGDTHKTTERINTWVSEHVKSSGYTRSRLGALYALKESKGDCTESADLFAALCRASEIPARTCGGYICLRDMIISADLYHNWAEFYDGTTWRLADPSLKQLDKMQNGYIAFQIQGNEMNSPMQNNTRYRLEADGISVKMN